MILLYKHEDKYLHRGLRGIIYCDSDKNLWEIIDRYRTRIKVLVTHSIFWDEIEADLNYNDKIKVLIYDGYSFASNIECYPNNSIVIPLLARLYELSRSLVMIHIGLDEKLIRQALDELPGTINDRIIIQFMSHNAIPKEEIQSRCLYHDKSSNKSHEICFRERYRNRFLPEDLDGVFTYNELSFLLFCSHNRDIPLILPQGSSVIQTAINNRESIRGDSKISHHRLGSNVFTWSKDGFSKMLLEILAN